MAQHEADLAKGDPNAYCKLKKCLAQKCKYDVKKVEKTKGDWEDVLNGDIEDQLQELKKRYDYQAWLKAFGLN